MDGQEETKAGLMDAHWPSSCYLNPGFTPVGNAVHNQAPPVMLSAWDINMNNFKVEAAQPENETVDKMKRARQINNAAVSRYRQRKKQEKDHLERTIKNIEKELAELKDEKRSLSLMEQAFASIVCFTEDIVSYLQSRKAATKSVMIEESGTEDSSDTSGSHPHGSCGTFWDYVVTTQTGSYIRHAIAQGLLTIPPEPLMRYKLKRLDTDGFTSLRRNFVERVTELLKEWESDTASRSSIEMVLHTMFKMQIRVAKILLEERTDLLHQIFQTSLAQSPKSAREMQQLMAKLELTQEQIVALKRLYDSHAEKEAEIRSSGANVSDRAAMLSAACSIGASQGDFLQCQNAVMELLGDLNEYSTQVTQACIETVFAAMKLLTILQRARIVVHYYPMTPDYMALLRQFAEFGSNTSYQFEELELSNNCDHSCGQNDDNLVQMLEG